ncbi:MAG TPA: hypothetical protein IAB12_06400 [Candidatus Ornithospirochaeta avicola]|uniref:Uncharacterized protein n=1 Tax=Candidatus Ornithospirochaeta avicola TaxID=2840896 RepID=A0A9D1TNA5_9SPIO|nr:hypothetical protein [Candidatus Ornithospirochaeta avicola]
MPVMIPVASRRDVKADAISSSRKIRLRNLIRPGMKLVKGAAIATVIS